MPIPHPLIDELIRIVGSDNVIVEASDLEPYLVDWKKRYHGSALAVVRPASTEEVAAIVRAASAHRVAIVAQGGNTGMVGGSVPDESGNSIVLSMRRMNRVIAIDPENNTITAEAGITLAELQAAAHGVDRLFPLSLASEGSCTLGGNLSTNAGGVAVLRYGNTRELCLALEAVIADGEVVGSRDGTLSGLRKDNTGYALRELFIGAEGTLGVVTKAVMKLFPVPRTQLTAWVGLESPEAALALLMQAQKHCASLLTAFELISDYALSLVLRHFPAQRSPLAARYPYAVLLEVSDHEDQAHTTALLEGLFEAALEDGVAKDVVIAQSIQQSRELWKLREFISEAQALEGQNIKHDISIPIGKLPRFITDTDAAIKASYPDVEMVTFGHLGDGNLHYNVSPGAEQFAYNFLSKQEGINRLVHDRVYEAGGSISAEHGIGQQKFDDLPRYKPAADLALMRKMKAIFDPNGIFNPGRVV